MRSRPLGAEARSLGSLPCLLIELRLERRNGLQNETVRAHTSATASRIR
jgi:hypothetical protein